MTAPRPLVFGFRRRCGWCGVQLRRWQAHLCRRCRRAATGDAGIYLQGGGPPCAPASRWEAAPDLWRWPWSPRRAEAQAPEEPARFGHRWLPQCVEEIDERTAEYLPDYALQLAACPAGDGHGGFCLRRLPCAEHRVSTARDGAARYGRVLILGPRPTSDGEPT